METIPPAPGDQNYFGTSPSDIWQAPVYGNGDGTFQHWDGTAWSTVSVDFIQTLSGPVAEANALWVTTGVGGNPVVWTLYRVHADGTVEEVALPPASVSKPIYRLYGYRGGLVAVVGGFGLDEQYHEVLVPVRLYRRDGDGWTALPDLPEEVVDATVRVGVDGELLVRVVMTNNYDINYGSYAACDGTGPSSPYLRLQGDTWVPVPADPCIVEVTDGVFDIANPIFPIDDVWTQNWRYDGTTIGPPQAPPTAGLMYTRGDGGTVRIFEQAKGAADPGEAYDCDAFGNCTTVDTFTYTGTDWVAETWDGTGWTDHREVAAGQTCVGAGCIWQGDLPGVVGTLEDGTVLIHQSGEDASGLAVVHP